MTTPTIFILLSRTEKILWDNPIPSCIFDYFSGLNTVKRQRHESLKRYESLKRHDPILMESFRHTYGQYLESCPFAHLTEIPAYCMEVYDIIRIPCYASSFYPERISIDIERCLELHYMSCHHDTKRIKDELKQITTSQYGVTLKDSKKFIYTMQRFYIMKNIY